jgi:hypothetical protein
MVIKSDSQLQQRFFQYSETDWLVAQCSWVRNASAAHAAPQAVAARMSIVVPYQQYH